jgi:nitrate reductase NapE component
MNTIGHIRPGQWADHPTAPDARFHDLDDERSAKGNASMALVCICVVLFPLLLAGVVHLVGFIVQHH